ncbi:hypothetical protein GMOD_00005738 [Pyrenophora seminiperda CCB06]|uniref:Uncharacterized protein n=1 Tax=Pyrenophora seminiperda CCB06 TaxID=1302712 RepID=A0A3M7M9K8_9PLEO|nr:hypothetical protein GMOD_00005738 [Pyrenophora seminiperda CCB06]
MLILSRARGKFQQAGDARREAKVTNVYMMGNDITTAHDPLQPCFWPLVHVLNLLPVSVTVPLESGRFSYVASSIRCTTRTRKRRLTDKLVWLLIKAPGDRRRTNAIGQRSFNVEQVGYQAAYEANARIPG